MGSSYMDYRDSGFWVKDFQAEVWLYLLAQQAQEMADAPSWLAAAGRDWHMQATVGFMGCVSSCLDEHLGTDRDRVAVAIDLSERGLQRLADWSPAIPREDVNSWRTGGEEESLGADLDVDPVLRCGRTFISLLRGELPPGNTGWAR